MTLRASLQIAVLSLLTAAVPSVAHCNEPADLVLLDAKVVTLCDAQPLASAIAIRGDRIVAVGSNDAMRPLINDHTRVIRLAGQLVLPGFIEGHGHFVNLGKTKMEIDLSQAKSWDEVVAIAKQAADRAGPGKWLIGRGWHQEKWSQPPTPSYQGFPSHQKLSAATPDNPVFFTHASGHMCLANAKAMQLAGVDRQTKNPAGGEILRDPSGEPIGIFRESAAGLIHAAWDRDRSNLTAEQVTAELDEAIRLAAAECLANGVTSFHDAGENFATIDHLRDLAESGKLPVRLWVMVGGEPIDVLAKKLPSYRLLGLADDHLTVRAIKEFSDGALGTRGAWLLAPYSDAPDSTGLSATPPSTIRKIAELAIQNGFQLCVHAIGDRANREVLNVFADAFRQHPDKTELRWRIEHAQHLDPADIPRFAQLGVIASMQGVHCTSDGSFVVSRLGVDRAKNGAYAWQSLLKSGAVVINGTDTPVEAENPIRCFYASVTRKLADGSTFFPEQRMTRMQALRSYTLDAAYAAFEEQIKGSLAPGKLADVVVLSKDIMTVPDDEILQAKALYTIVGGKVLYTRDREATREE